MKQFFDERMLGAREGKIEGGGRGEGGEGCEKGQAGRSEKASGWGFQRGCRYLDLFSRIGFLRAGGGGGGGG